MTDALSEARARARVSRDVLRRDAAMAPDTTHRALRCARCQRVNLDVRAFEGRLQLADGGARTVDDLASLVAVLPAYLDGVAGAPPDPCACGAPWTALTPLALWFFHDVPGGGGALVAEVTREGASLASVCAGGAPRPLDVDDHAAMARFGVPVTLTPLWRALLDAGVDAVTEVEPGFALGLFSDPAALESSRGSRRVAALTAKAVADPSWAWLRARGDLSALASKALVTLVDDAALRERVLSLVAQRGLAATVDGEVVTVEDALAAWPVELAAVADEGMRASLTLSATAAAAVGAAVERLAPQREFARAITELRPGVTLAREGTLLVPSVEGREGRPFDLRAAPFGAVADLDALERDLRFHLDEAAPWVDLARVCPCGAHRLATLRLLTEASYAAMTARPTERGARVVETFHRDGAPVARACVALECDRHVDYAVDGIDHVDLALERCEGEVSFALRAAWHDDGRGRRCALAQGAALGSAALRPAWRRGLCAALGAPEGVVMEVVTRDTVLVAERDVDGAFAARLAAAGVVLARHQGLDATPLGLRFDGGGESARGVFTVEG